MSLSAADRIVDEKSTPVYSMTITNQVGDPVAREVLETLTFVLYDEKTGEFINGHGDPAATDVLTDPRFTVGESNGVVTWAMEQDDNVIVAENLPAGSLERHIGLFVATWDEGEKVKRHEVIIDVRQLAKVA